MLRLCSCVDREDASVDSLCSCVDREEAGVTVCAVAGIATENASEDDYYNESATRSK